MIDRTRIGINLGPSPKHDSSVALILSLQTGLVSPKFHCSYDDLFELTKGTQARSVTISLFHSLIRASVEDLGCLNYLLLDKNARPNSIISVVLYIFNIEVYSNALYYL